jgi:hypothetical protein
VVLWGSGLGADAARDSTYTPAAFAINNLAQIYVGGVPATIQYQGASGYPGVNQMNVVIPQNAPTGCFVPITGVTTSGVPTNAIILPIANGSCSDPALGYTSGLLAQLSGQQNVNRGVLNLDYLTEPNQDGTGTDTVETAAASFETLSGLTYGISDGVVSIGGCILNKGLYDPPATNVTIPAGLNAGAITVTPPGQFSKPVSLIRGTLTPGEYGTTLPSGFLTMTGGTFTFAGTGGPVVGSFTAPITFSSPLQTWTNQNSLGTVRRGTDLVVKWSGGDPGTITTLLATAYGTGSRAQFLCAADTAAGQLTVPSWILAAFPAASGVLTLQNQTAFQSFTATGTDRAYTRGSVATEIFTEFQ